MTTDTFSFQAKSLVVGPKSACVFGTQEEHTSLYHFLKEHEGKQIKVTYEVVKKYTGNPPYCKMYDPCNHHENGGSCVGCRCAK